jgi:hypothetical protein
LQKIEKDHADGTGATHIIEFLRLKGLKLLGIATDFSRAYGQDTHASSSIKYCIYQNKLGRTDFQMQDVGGRSLLDHLNTEILLTLRGFPWFFLPSMLFAAPRQRGKRHRLRLSIPAKIQGIQ